MIKGETLSGRLKFAMKRAGISQANLARSIGIKPAALQYLLASNARSSRFTFELAHALNVRTEWLAAGAGPMVPEDDPLYRLLVKYKRIPILKPEEIQGWLINNSHSENYDDWILVPVNTGVKSFAFSIPDASMKPTFSKGDIVTVDSAKKPVNNDLVLARLETHNEIIFRKYASLDKSQQLTPINQEMYKPIYLKKEDNILGTATEVRVQL